MQVSWIFEPTDAERTNIAVFHPNFGANYPTKSPLAGRVHFISDPPTLDNPSIQIEDVKMTDEGRYICEYATYPSGNEQGVSSLIMLGEFVFLCRRKETLKLLNFKKFEDKFRELYFIISD